MVLTVVEPRQLSNGEAFRVYPNPVKNITNLEVTTPVENIKLSLSIYDMTGKVMAKKYFVTSSAKSNFKVDMSGFMDGLYILNLAFENGKTLSAKVMKIGMGK